MISVPIFCRRLVGRERELHYLVERRRALSKTHGGIVLVGGEAGIGKSRLIRTFLEVTKSARGRVAVAQCRPFGSRPYGAILDLLTTFAPMAPEAMPAATRDAQHKSLVDGFLRAAERHALVGVIEDFHWSDRGTAAILEQLSDAIASRRVLLVVTYRNDELGADHPLYVPLAAVMRGRSVSPLQLAPLSARETTELIAAALEGSATTVSAQTRRDIARIGEGNPFFTEELLKGAVDREHSERFERGLPTTVRAAILQRMEPLDARDREILTQAAVIGRRFGGDILAQTLGSTFESLLPTLQRARRCQLVEETADPRTFRFRHALTREAIYDDLLAAQRRPLHERIALALEAAGDERSVEDLAYHWWATGDRLKALRYGERAGDIALRLYEYSGAVAAYERTLTLLDPLERDAARVNEKIGTSYYRAGMMDRAIEYYTPAWEYFRTTRDDPAYLFRTCRNMAGAFFNDGRNRDAIALWKDALEVVSACGDERVADLARITRAAYLADDGDVEGTLEVLASLDERRVDGDPELALGFWSATSVVSALRGDRERLRSATQRVFAMRPGRAFLGPLNDALLESGAAALYVGETACARECFREALEGCLSMKSTAMLLADTLLVNAFERVHAGAYVEARTYLRRALDILGETRVSWYRARFVALWLRNATGEAEPSALDDRDAETLDAAFASGKASLYGPLAAASAVDLLTRGDAASARALVRRAVNAASAASSSLGSFPLVVVAALACEGSDANAVRALAARDASKGPAPAAAAELVIAILARRFGAAKADLEPAHRAAAGFAEVGWPFFEALALDEAGDRVAAAAVRERIGHVQPAQPANREGIRSLLTARELQIASLVSRGRTNREVANRLFVSVKLVEKQLSSIYSKLGVSSRSQLTARLLTPDANEIEGAPISS